VNASNHKIIIIAVVPTIGHEGIWISSCFNHCIAATNAT